jgi:uncharacterized protein with HEPN domain
MQHKIFKFLYDIQLSIESIESYIGNNRNFNEYLENKMLRRAVEREFEIIGEALNQINKIDNSLEISFQKQIINLRNRVIHSYDNVDDEVIWGIIVRHLPVLKTEIEKLLNL